MRNENGKSEMRNEMQNAKWKMEKAKCEMEKAKWEMRNGKSEMRNGQKSGSEMKKSKYFAPKMSQFLIAQREKRVSLSVTVDMKKKRGNGLRNA